jgi:hypothetical protein
MTRFISLVFLLFANPAFAEQIFCDVTSKQKCSASGCSTLEMLEDDYRVINLKTKTIMLGTDEAPIKQAYATGVFDVYEMGSGSAFLKVVRTDVPLAGLNKGQFIEQRDMATTSILSWGLCQ